MSAVKTGDGIKKSEEHWFRSFDSWLQNDSLWFI